VLHFGSVAPSDVSLVFQVAATGPSVLSGLSLGIYGPGFPAGGVVESTGKLIDLVAAAVWFSGEPSSMLFYRFETPLNPGEVSQLFFISLPQISIGSTLFLRQATISGGSIYGLTSTIVPEPGAAWLLLLGLTSLSGRARWNSHRRPTRR
jgi:hypothetical protein